MRTKPDRIDARGRFDTALSALDEERRRTAAELDALSEFKRRVRAIEPIQPTRSVGNAPGSGGALAGRQPVAVATAEAGLSERDRIERAYRETVMAVQHYEEEYDDTYPESLADEFSRDVASVLTAPGAFDPGRKRTVLSAVDDSVRARELLLDVVDREREAIESAADELVPIDEELAALAGSEFDRKRFGTLDAQRARLDVVAENCEALFERRQGEIFDQRRIQRLPADVPDITVYFYRSLPFDYPACSVLADVLRRVDSIRADVERAAAFCDA
jgi:hypothetical protein